MAVVRCAIHNIPYNDENPRGCPACARAREGDPQQHAMRELARASQLVRRPAEAASDPDEDLVVVLSPPVTQPPRPPLAGEGRLRQWLRVALEHRLLAGAALVVLLALIYFSLSLGPEFIAGADPPRYSGDVHPLPVEPGQPVEVVFTVLGPREPQPHPTAPSLARYSYGSDLAIDGLNGLVYNITIGVPNWSWRGLTVGLSPIRVDGLLALLGKIDTTQTTVGAPQHVSGYTVFPTLPQRPKRTLRVQLRPPNGCLDVFVDLQPRAIGALVSGDQRYAVVGGKGTAPEWVSTSVRVVSRAVAGPGGNAVC